MAPRVVLLAFLLVALLAPASAQAAGNPADALAATAIDPYRYDHAKSCRKSPPAGTVALKTWLEANAGGTFWGTMRCERWGKDSASLHAEGRALDWHLDAGNPRQRRNAMRLIDLLLAPDRTGEPTALARRMGVQGLIFNCRQWFAGMSGLDRYSYCFAANGRRRRHLNRTEAHMDHVHIELTWAGARMRTSFWRWGSRR